MRVTNRQKQSVLVFGIPRSGTTITCTFLNSIKNAFCISEPILGAFLNPTQVRWDKIEVCNETDPHLIMEHCQTELYKRDEFLIGGIKEIWTPLHRAFSDCALESDRFDKTIFVVRNPVDIFASWRATTWGRQPTDDQKGLLSYDDPNYMIFTYQKYLELIEQHSNKGKVLLYESFIVDPKKTMNLCGIMVEGEVSLRNNIYQLGDGNARKSKNVNKMPSKRRLLHDKEIEKIESSEPFKAYQEIKEQQLSLL